jgi:hypothetical protein
MTTPPTWLNSLPRSPKSGRRMVAVDNNAISDYYFRTPQPAVRFVFEDSNVELHLCRQVIDEALNHPDLTSASRRQIWTSLAALQAQGKVLLSGTAVMPPQMMSNYRDLQQLLARSGLSREDAFVLADAVVKRVPLLTRDGGARTGAGNALRNREVQRFLTSRGLPNTEAQILVG